MPEACVGDQKISGENCKIRLSRKLVKHGKTGETSKRASGRRQLAKAIVNFVLPVVVGLIGPLELSRAAFRNRGRKFGQEA